MFGAVWSQAETRKVLGAITCIEKNGHGKAAHIKCGMNQELIFRETDKPLPEFDGHHLQVYVDDFGTPHEKLKKLDLITEESDRCQYRFEDIIALLNSAQPNDRDLDCSPRLIN